jgi:tRNA A-37 threonylcarbamoyl transferase component Bud32
LQQECADDPSLRSEVRKLLENDAHTGDFPQLGTAPAPMQSFAAGDLAAGRFRIVRLLGRGGMGEVYEAEDTLLGERVALKTIRREIAADPAILSRFHHEIQLTRRITHPNVCRIFDLEMHLGDPTAPTAFLTMELLLGETLAARLERSGAVSPDEALTLARQMAAGLEAAHQCGIIHRDFKSGNVMLVPGRDGHRKAAGDIGLHGARTIGERRDELLQRHIRPGSGAVRDGHRNASIPCRNPDCIGVAARARHAAFAAQPAAGT